MHGKKPGIKQSVTIMGRFINMLNRDLHRIAGQIRHRLHGFHGCSNKVATAQSVQFVPE